MSDSPHGVGIYCYTNVACLKSTKHCHSIIVSVRSCTIYLREGTECSQGVRVKTDVYETSRLSRWRARPARLTASASLSYDTSICVEEVGWSVWLLPSPVTCFDKFRAGRGGAGRTSGKQATEGRPPPPDGTSATRHGPCGRVLAVGDQPLQTAERCLARPTARPHAPPPPSPEETVGWEWSIFTTCCLLDKLRPR